MYVNASICAKKGREIHTHVYTYTSDSRTACIRGTDPCTKSVTSVSPPQRRGHTVWIQLTADRVVLQYVFTGDNTPKCNGPLQFKSVFVQESTV